MGKTIGIISGKGGVGKTTTALNLGILFAQENFKTVVLEGNISTPNIGLHLGSTSLPVTLNHVLNLKNKIEEATYTHQSGLKVIPADITLEASLNPDLSMFPQIANDLKKTHDYIIIDGAAGLGKESLNVVSLLDYAIIITTPDIISITEAMKAIKLCKLKKKEVLGVVVTRYNNDYNEIDLDKIRELTRERIIGVINEDVNVRKSLQVNQPVVYTHPKTKAAKDYYDTLKLLLGKTISEKVEKEDSLSLFRKIINKFQKKKQDKRKQTPNIK